MDPPTRPEPPRERATESIPWRDEAGLAPRLREDLRCAAEAIAVGVDFGAVAARLRAAIAPRVTSRAGAPSTSHHDSG
jgi:hypothetical protein